MDLVSAYQIFTSESVSAVTVGDAVVLILAVGISIVVAKMASLGK